MKKNNWMVISFYTPKYKLVSENLENSLIKNKIPHRILELEDQGSWVKNCAMKPKIILGAILEYERPVVWIDADAVVNEYPKLFDEIEEDFACHFLQKPKGNRELLSGTLFVNNKIESIQFMTEWVEDQKRHPNEWDQRTLANVLERKRPGLKVKELPGTYTQIFDTMRNEGKPVIEHFQHSRKLRNR